LNILIATPAYGNMVHTDLMHSVLAIVRGGVRSGVGVDVVTVGNCSLVPLARNNMIAYFYQNPQYTHIFFLDADMGLPKETLPMLLKNGVGIVAAPVAMKGEDRDGNPLLNVGKITGERGHLLIVERVGAAILLIDRAAAVTLCEGSEKYSVDQEFQRGDMLTDVSYDVFQCGPHGGWYWPEDYGMCRKAIELGLDVHVDPRAANIHNGNYRFEYKGVSDE